MILMYRHNDTLRITDHTESNLYTISSMFQVCKHFREEVARVLYLCGHQGTEGTRKIAVTVMVTQIAYIRCQSVASRSMARSRGTWKSVRLRLPPPTVAERTVRSRL